MHGFQLWANLPAALKMTDPRYQDIPAAAIPEVTEDDGTHARVICGEFWGQQGPVNGVATESNVAARYVDISVPPGSGSGSRWRHRGMRLRMSLLERGRFATPRRRRRC